MLFHSVYDDGAADVYTVQVSVGLAGPVDADRLERAAAALLRRHPNLRAGFWHEGCRSRCSSCRRRCPSPWSGWT